MGGQDGKPVWSILDHFILNLDLFCLIVVETLETLFFKDLKPLTSPKLSM